MTIANVTLTNTFDEWRTTTNQLIGVYDETNTLAVAAYNSTNSVTFTAANLAANVLVSNTIILSAITNTVNTAVPVVMTTNTQIITLISDSANGIASNINYAGVILANSSIMNEINLASSAAASNAVVSNTTIINTIYTNANTIVEGFIANTDVGAAFVTANAAFDKANSASIVILDDAEDQTRYVSFVNAATGNASTLNVSSTSLTFNPFSGTLSATTFNSLSDYNLKTNILQIGGALDTINSLNGVSFEWKNNGLRSYGVIAQDIEKHIPDLVGNVDGTKNVNYDGIIAFLIEAIKELNRKLDAK